MSALTALTEGNFIYFGEINASESDLMKVERDYISAWYGQTKGISLAELCTLKRGKHLKVMSLPPTTSNLFEPVRGAPGQASNLA